MPIQPLSWIDKLIRWISALPGPSWLAYVIGLIAAALLIVSLEWLDGGQSFPNYDSSEVSNAIWIILPLAILHYINRHASEALKVFRPLLSGGEKLYLQWKAKISNVPPLWAWIAFAISALFVFLNLLSSQSEFVEMVGISQFTEAIRIMFGASALAISFTLFVQVIRHLFIVHTLHKGVKAVNLFQLDAPHAFSTLTSRIGAGLALITVFSLLQNSSYDSALAPFDFLTFVIAIIAFVFPLLIMRRKLNQEKSKIINQGNLRLEALYQKINQYVDADQYAKVGDLKQAMETLIIERDEILKISTWPWEARTLRGFSSTILIPILLWFITRLLERFL